MATRKPAPSRKKEPTKDIRDRACKILASGTFRDTTRKRLGIAQGLWAKWIADGKLERAEVDEGRREELGPRGKFVVAIEGAEALAHDKIYDQGVVHAGPEAQRWFLARRYPELYSTTPARGLIDDDSGELVKVDAREFLKEKLRLLLEGAGSE
jgi:hypothetical protein